MRRVFCAIQGAGIFSEAATPGRHNVWYTVWAAVMFGALHLWYRAVARPIPQAEYLPVVNEFTKTSCVWYTVWYTVWAAGTL